MAVPKSPHTQTQQDTQYDQTDLNPDDMPQTVATGADASIYENRDGAQTGSERSPKHMPMGANPPNTLQQPVAYEGTLTSRVSDEAERQGISNRSAQSERAGQQKVVDAREDAQAGVNHSDKIPPR